MQIATNKLLAKDADVTRSTVQKAVVILATKPAFGPIKSGSFRHLRFPKFDQL